MGKGVALAASRAKANTLTDRGMRGGGRGVAVAYSELLNCDRGLQKSTGVCVKEGGDRGSADCV